MQNKRYTSTYQSNWFASSLLLVNLSFLLLSQLFLTSLEKSTAQIRLFIRQSPLQVREKTILTQMNTSIQTVQVALKPIEWLLALFILLCVLVLVHPAFSAYQNKKIKLLTLYQTIFLPIISIFILLTIIWLLFQPQIISLMEWAQLKWVPFFTNSQNHSLSLDSAILNHLTIKLPSTTQALLQVNRLSIPQWSVLMTKILSLNFCFICMLVGLILCGYWYCPANVQSALLSHRKLQMNKK